MSHPIDIIANAIRTADGEATLGAGRLAEVAAEALTNEAIIENAVQALIDDGWEETPSQTYTISHEDLANIARVVLRSVATS